MSLSAAATELWTVFCDTTLRALPCPWQNKPLGSLTADDLAMIEGRTSDFGIYSPSDGDLDICHVPNNLPRRVPVCRTTLAICHDADALYIIQSHDRPEEGIPELADLENEDFLLAIQMGGFRRGLYFGMNEKGEHIGCVQLWDKQLHPADTLNEYPWTLLQQKPGSGPGGTAAGILSANDYTARVLRTPSGLAAVWRISLSLLSSGIDGKNLRLSAARQCYRTGEQVCWGAGIQWSSRMDRMGTVHLATTSESPLLPRLHRVDLEMDFTKEQGTFHAIWKNAEPENLSRLNTGQYAQFNQRYSFFLNGLEQTQPLGRQTVNTGVLDDGWNRIEYITSYQSAVAFFFEKRNSTQLTPPAYSSTTQLPSAGELRQLFTQWHEGQEAIYHGNGAWSCSSVPDNIICLCHGGVFHALPYLLACQHLDDQPAYRDRIRQTATRMLDKQHTEGWYPCYCSALKSQQPARFEGGAFTNGSVGEFMAIAGKYLGEPSWLESSRRAADAYKWYRWEMNENYSAFALWHLAELYEQTGEERDLERAVYYADHFSSRDIGPCGAQDAHNYYTGYGNITLKGLARLLRVLPAEHPFYPTLRTRVMRFTNQMLSRLQPDGLCTGRNRRYVGYSHVIPGFFAVAQALPEISSALEPVLILTYKAVEAHLTANKPEWGDGYLGLTIACLARHIHNRKGNK